VAENSVKEESKLLLKHSSIYGLGPGLARVAGFVMTPIYTAYLAPADYGVMELAFMTTSLIEMVVGMGVNHGVTRFYFESDVQSERNEVISSAFLGLGGIVAPIILALVACSGLISSYVLDSREYATYFTLAFLAMGIGILNNINMAYLRAEKKSLLVVLTSTGQLVVNLALNIIFMVYCDMGLAGIFWAHLISTILAMAVVTPMVMHKVGYSFSFDIVKGLIMFGLPMIPSNVASYIVIASDRFFIKEYVSIAEAGIYSLGYKFGTLVMNFATNPFNQIYGPRRLELFKKADSDEFFGRIFTYFVVFVVFVGLAVSLVSRDLVELMAEERYWEAWKIVPLITLAHILLSFFYHFHISIVIEKKTKYFAYINVTNGLLNLALNFLLIPPYGVWGAAWATTICYFFRSAACYYYGNKLRKIYLEWRRVGISSVVALAFYFLFGRIDIGGSIVNIAVKSLICCAYPAVLYVVGFFHAEEKDYLHRKIGSLTNKLLRR
jgi:O-antigen/teichoic acid export membrane protein